MRHAWIAVLLVACSHHAAPKPPAAEEKPPAEAAPTLPPGAVVADGEDTTQGRATFAVGFLTAAMKHDDAALEGYGDARGLCELIAKVKGEGADAATLDACTDETRANNAEGFAAYEEQVPADFAMGATEEYAIDAEQGIYMVSVHRQDDENQVLAVMLIEYGGRRFVVFPRKKE